MTQYIRNNAFKVAPSLYSPKRYDDIKIDPKEVRFSTSKAVKRSIIDEFA